MASETTTGGREVINTINAQEFAAELRRQKAKATENPHIVKIRNPDDQKVAREMINQRTK